MRMTFSKFAACMAVIVALTAPAAAQGVAPVPYGAGPGWWGRPLGPGNRPYPPGYFGSAQGRFYWQPYWSGEQQEHVVPHK